jgi:hypothetical protein
VNSGRNALGGGGENRANLTIGRALRLVVQNIGGAKPGFSEMATIGLGRIAALRHRSSTLYQMH